MRELTMREAINEAMRIALVNDERVFIMGEDIARHGGQLRCTFGLFDDFGGERVRNCPISESAIMGAALGSALVGMRPIAELPYIDFLGVCFDQIMNQIAKIRFLYGGRCTAPLVIRTQGGAGLGNAAQHSQSLEALFCHIPGLKVVMPSMPGDAKGLLLRAINDDNPVVFIEHKALFNKKGPVEEKPYEIPFGVADIKRKGNDVTIVATSAMVWEALEAAEELMKSNISAEVIDPRTLAPLDMDTILASVRKTNHVVIAHEACKNFGVGAELATRIQEGAFDYLDAPILRVAAPNVPVPYAEPLEKEFIPQASDIVSAVAKCLNK